MIRVNQIKIDANHNIEQLEQKICQILYLKKQELTSYTIVKKSIDARKKPLIYYIYVVDVVTSKEDIILKQLKKYKNQVQPIQTIAYQFPTKGTKQLEHRPIIIGAGPAGLFCAYFLAKEGYQPILLERGKEVDQRQIDVALFWEQGILNPESNVQFGEGGAGTFSDGKLNTLNKDKDGKNKEVMQVFVDAGANPEILYDSKPHIGTDVLCKVVKEMREKIIQWGGEVRFEQKVTDLLIHNSLLQGVIVNQGEAIHSNVVVLAIGHSARDTFQMLYDQGVNMEAKSFAVGFRIEHLQSKMNESQYGACNLQYLPQATYKVTATADNKRGVYSFCMCPGGYVVNASSEVEKLVINGMSYSKRDGANANSAIIVSVMPEDFSSNHPLAGVEFQRKLESKAYRLANGKIPVQRFGAFQDKIKNTTCYQEAKQNKDIELQPATKGEYEWSDLSQLLPATCNQAFLDGMEQFGKKIHNFDHVDSILSGIESRTSSPIRIKRNDLFDSNISGLYPCGEGAGYAGGITSAAMDGMKIAEAIGKKYAPLTRP